MVLVEGVAVGPENGGKETVQGPATQAMETGEGRIVKEALKSQSSEPMDHDGHFCNAEKRADLFRKDSTKVYKEKGPEGPELSLEELSISSKHHLPAGSRGPGQHAQQMEDAPHRVSRKRKLLDDTEDSKNLLLEAYRVWQQGQKVTAYDLAKIENIMCKTYMLIKQVRNFLIINYSQVIYAPHGINSTTLNVVCLLFDKINNLVTIVTLACL